MTVSKKAKQKQKQASGVASDRSKSSADAKRQVRLDEAPPEL